MSLPDLGEYSGAGKETSRMSPILTTSLAAHADVYKPVCKTCGISISYKSYEHSRICEKYWPLNRTSSYTSYTKLSDYKDEDNRLFLKEYLVSFLGILDKYILKQHVKEYCQMKYSHDWKSYLADPNDSSKQDEACGSSTDSLSKEIVKHFPIRKVDQKTKKCEFCNKCFGSVYELLACYKEHATVEKSRYYICEECQQLFSSEHLYVKHMHMFRKRDEESANEQTFVHKNYPCDVCGLMFKEYVERFVHVNNLCRRYSTWQNGAAEPTTMKRRIQRNSRSLRQDTNKTLSYFHNFLTIYDRVVMNYKDRRRISSFDGPTEANAEQKSKASQIDMRSILNQPRFGRAGPSERRSTRRAQGIGKKTSDQKITPGKRSANFKDQVTAARLGTSINGKTMLKDYLINNTSEVCEFCFMRQSDLTKCYAYHFCSTREWLICEVCDELFYSTEAFKIHMDEQHRWTI